jgi:hypothetical protein
MLLLYWSVWNESAKELEHGLFGIPATEISACVRTRSVLIDLSLALRSGVDRRAFTEAPKSTGFLTHDRKAVTIRANFVEGVADAV